MIPAMSKDWVLVTGASGFVGSRLVHALVDRGQKVKAFVRAGSSLKQLMGLPKERFKLAYGDVRVEHTVYRALGDVSRMYHVASSFQMWDPKPERILEPAIEGTRAVLRAAQKRDLEKVVVTSSVAALGTTTRDAPMDESHEFNLADPETYILSKHEALRATQELVEDGVQALSVLPTGIVGPGDWKPTPTGESILGYLRNASRFRIPVTVGGLNLVDVDDVVEGHIRAMEAGTIGESYILGGDNLTFRQLFETLSELTGLAPPGRTTSRGMAELAGRFLELRARLRGGEPPLTYRLARDYANAYAWVTSAKAESELGYSHRPARAALARSLRWYLERGYVPGKSARHIRLELSHT